MLTTIGFIYLIYGTGTWGSIDISHCRIQTPRMCTFMACPKRYHHYFIKFDSFWWTVESTVAQPGTVCCQTSVFHQHYQFAREWSIIRANILISFCLLYLKLFLVIIIDTMSVIKLANTVDKFKNKFSPKDIFVKYVLDIQNATGVLMILTFLGKSANVLETLTLGK